MRVRPFSCFREGPVPVAALLYLHKHDPTARSAVAQAAEQLKNHTRCLVHMSRVMEPNQ